MLDTGLEIRILRERLKMSAKELAEKIGLSPSQMSRLEKGQRRIDMKMLERISRALDVSPSHFFPGTSAPSQGVIPSVVPREIGKLLRSERRLRHISAEDLARKVGRPKSVVESIEQGKRDLDPELADRILKVLKLPSNYLLKVQQQIIRGLQGQVERLNEELREEVSLLGDDGTEESRAATPILGSVGGGYPRRFDVQGRPLAEVSGRLRVPVALPQGAFALHVVGDSMEGESAPSFREGDLVVFAAETLRSRDFGFARIQGEDPTFRQVFFDPGGQTRFQPRNLNYPSSVYPRKRILGLWRLVGHYTRY